MKKLIMLLFVLSIYSIAFAKDKVMLYEKDSKIVKGEFKTQVLIRGTTDRMDIYCQDSVMNGAVISKFDKIAIDEKDVPVDIATTEYKIDAIKKEIYQEVILGDK